MRLSCLDLGIWDIVTHSHADLHFLFHFIFTSFSSQFFLVLMSKKENCPFHRERTLLQYFRSLPRYEDVKQSSIIIDGCIGDKEFLITAIVYVYMCIIK